MFEFVIGVVVGALFAPFWMKAFAFVKAAVEGVKTDKPAE